MSRMCSAVWLTTLLLPIIILGSLFFIWSAEIDQLRDRVSNHRAQIQNLQNAASEIPALKAALKAERERDDLKQYFFQGQTWSLAAGLAQGHLNELMSDANLVTNNVETLRQQASQSFERIRLRAQAQGTTEQLASLRYSIETATSFLVIEDLAVRPLPQPVRGRGAPASASNADSLVIQLQVSGFIYRE